jgi:hypothetical protein
MYTIESKFSFNKEFKAFWQVILKKIRIFLEKQIKITMGMVKVFIRVLNFLSRKRIVFGT